MGYCSRLGISYVFTRKAHKMCKGKFNRFYLSCDYGTVNPFSLGLWGECDGKWFRLDEYYYSGRDNGIQLTDEEYYRELEKLAENREITALIIDPSAASFIQTVLRHGKFRVVKANNDVLTGINRVCQALKDEEIFIYPACTDAIREFSIYRWDDNIKKDAVKKENDHAMDDIRYFVATVLGRENQNSAFASVAIERN